MNYSRVLFIFFLVLFFLANFGSINSPEISIVQALEIEYPTIPGAETPQTKPLLPNYIRYIFNFSLFIASLICLASFIYGGARYIFSAGKPAAMADAKDQILAGFLGLIILLCAWYILATVNPQLIVLKLPGLPEIRPVFPILPSPSPLGPTVSKFQEIPVGTLITSEGEYSGLHSDYEGALDNKRLERILTLSATTTEVAIALRDLAKELNEKLKVCACSQCNKGDCIIPGGCPSSCRSNCACTGAIGSDWDPCRPNRADIQNLQKAIRIFADAFEAFLKKEGARYETVGLVISAYRDEIFDGVFTCIEGKKYSIVPFHDSCYYQNLILKMLDAEITYEGIEENKNQLSNINKTGVLDKLEKAELEIKNCYPFLVSYSEYQRLRVDPDWKTVETAKDIPEFQTVDIGEEPATFYCPKK